MTIDIVGLGLNPEDPPNDIAITIERADVLVGGEKHLEFFQMHPAVKIPIGKSLDQLIRKIDDFDARGLRVVILATGDPLYYGIGKRIVEELGGEGICVHPNVTTLQAAAARLLVPWNEIRPVSLHGRDDLGELFAALACCRKVAVYTDASNTPDFIARAMIERGAEDFAMWVLEDMETPKENVRRYNLHHAAQRTFSPLNLVVLERTRDPELPPALGLSEEVYLHERGLITRASVRAAGIAALRLLPHHLVWDLGAGCGTMAVEASILVREGRVAAVEMDAGRTSMIRENVRKTGAYIVEVVHGQAPECLENLPDPDRIFIGGGLGKRRGVLRTSCARLKPGGRLVIYLIVHESLHRAADYLKELGWPAKIEQITVDTVQDPAGNMRRPGQNHVFILSADKPSS